MQASLAAWMLIASATTSPVAAQTPAHEALPDTVEARTVEARIVEPRIIEIRLIGNEKTRDKVILRELDLAPGDIADPAAIEDGRQAVLDLGLFREVKATTHDVDGGVVLELAVREKYHLL